MPRQLNHDPPGARDSYQHIFRTCCTPQRSLKAYINLVLIFRLARIHTGSSHSTRTIHTGFKDPAESWICYAYGTGTYPCDGKVRIHDAECAYLSRSLDERRRRIQRVCWRSDVRLTPDATLAMSRYRDSSLLLFTFRPIVFAYPSVWLLQLRLLG